MGETVNSRLEVEILLSHLLDVKRVYLYKNMDLPIEIDMDKFSYLMKQKSLGVPIEYLTNSVSFYSETFYVDNSVLVPRPETEILIDIALKEITNSKLKVAEIGTGSGVISIMLSKKLKNNMFIATDISKKAIDVAKKNALIHSVSNINFVNTNLLDNIEDKIDILVSNPPYIEDDYEIPLPLHYEPKEALFGGFDGLALIKKIIDITIEKNIFILICEIGYNQKNKIIEFVKNKKYKTIQFYKDLSGLDRGFIMKL
jgi:release factor glutamine methyltransferase